MSARLSEPQVRKHTICGYYFQANAIINLLKTKQIAGKKGIGDRISAGLIAATPGEAGPLAARVGLRKVPFRGLVCLRGRWGAADIVCLISGIGKANAAHATGVLIRDFSPDMIVSFGVGGAYPGSGLAVGDIAVATTEVYADEGVILREGFRTLETIGIPAATAPRRKFFNEFPLDRALAKRALRAAGKRGSASSGVFATVSSCSGTRQLALRLSKRLNAVCENMEGAAVAHISRLYNVPAVEVRGISNIVEDRDLTKWNIPLAADAASGAVLDFLEDVAGRGR